MADNEDELVDYDEEEVRQFPPFQSVQRVPPIEKTWVRRFGRIATCFYVADF